VETALTRGTPRFLRIAFVEGISTGYQTQSDTVVESGSPILLTGAKRRFTWSVRSEVSRYPQGANGVTRERVGWGSSRLNGQFDYVRQKLIKNGFTEIKGKIPRLQSWE